MKKITAIIALGAVIASATAVQAADLKPYVSGKISYSNLSLKDTAIKYADGSIMNEGTDESKGVFGGKIAAGIAIPLISVRAELEVGYNSKAEVASKNTKDAEKHVDLSAQTSTYMFNAYYDIDTGTAFKPYIGAGIGFANINMKANSSEAGVYSIATDESINNFTYGFSVGVSYAVNDNLSLDLGYRYTNFGKVEDTVKYWDATMPVGRMVDLESETKLSSHEILLGTRYSF
ncbi:MAG: porin family protein [Puniceicoccales bacterium]|jgi:opacity protein-like surface antigen|nr:porin family protein [Puniceicoccales bacterium]